MASGYGWELEYIKEMSEIDMYLALKNLKKINEQDKVRKLNDMMISTAAGFGSKKAYQQIKKLSDEQIAEQRREDRQKKIEQGVAKSDVPLLGADELKDILGKVNFNGGRQKS